MSVAASKLLNVQLLLINNNMVDVVQGEVLALTRISGSGKAIFLDVLAGCAHFASVSKISILSLSHLYPLGWRTYGLFSFHFATTAFLIYAMWLFLYMVAVESLVVLLASLRTNLIVARTLVIFANYL